MRPLLITAHLASPLCIGAEGPPMLDSLLELAASATCDPRNGQGVHKERLTRDRPPPEQGSIRIPLVRSRVGPWLIAHCSDPIMPQSRESVEHVNKRLGTENVQLVDPAQHKQICHTNTWTKAYRLPMRLVHIPCVAWFAVGEQGEIRRLLRRIHSIGKKISVGYGKVARWDVQFHDKDVCWYMPHSSGNILMRRMPRGEWLPGDLLGYKPSYGACTGPYWHPERYCELVVPC